MPWFPILPDELAATEARLGIAFPLGYRAIVGDPKMRALLAHPTVGAIDLDMTMAEFAVWPDELKPATNRSVPFQATAVGLLPMYEGLPPVQAGDTSSVPRRVIETCALAAAAAQRTTRVLRRNMIGWLGLGAAGSAREGRG